MSGQNRNRAMKTFHLKIEIRPADGVLDPQGKTVLSTLKKLGFGGVLSVTAGKLIQLKIESEDENSAKREADRMCSELLANPVIEVFSIKVSPADGENGNG